MPLRNCALVHTDATVVISLMTALAGGVLPSTDNHAIAGLSPPLLLTAAAPPWAVRYRITSGPMFSWLLSWKLPSVPVLVWASCLGSLLLPAHRVTVALASGPPPAWAWPSTCTAAVAAPHVLPSKVAVSQHRG